MDSYSNMSLNFPFLIFFFFCHRELDRDKTFPNHFKYSVHPDSGRERGQGTVIGKGQQDPTGLTVRVEITNSYCRAATCTNTSGTWSYTAATALPQLAHCL